MCDRSHLACSIRLAHFSLDLPKLSADFATAQNFFEAKSKQLSDSNKFENEIKKEQEAKKVELEAAKQRRADFKAKAASFQ